MLDRRKLGEMFVVALVSAKRPAESEIAVDVKAGSQNGATLTRAFGIGALVSLSKISPLNLGESYPGNEAQPVHMSVQPSATARTEQAANLDGRRDLFIAQL